MSRELLYALCAVVAMQKYHDLCAIEWHGVGHALNCMNWHDVAVVLASECLRLHTADVAEGS